MRNDHALKTAIDDEIEIKNQMFRSFSGFDSYVYLFVYHFSSPAFISIAHLDERREDQIEKKKSEKRNAIQRATGIITVCLLVYLSICTATGGEKKQSNGRIECWRAISTVT